MIPLLIPLSPNEIVNWRAVNRIEANAPLSPFELCFSLLFHDRPCSLSVACTIVGLNSGSYYVTHPVCAQNIVQWILYLHIVWVHRCTRTTLHIEDRMLVARNKQRCVPIEQANERKRLKQQDNQTNKQKRLDSFDNARVSKRDGYTGKGPTMRTTFDMGERASDT